MQAKSDLVQISCRDVPTEYVAWPWRPDHVFGLDMHLLPYQDVLRSRLSNKVFISLAPQCSTHTINAQLEFRSTQSSLGMSNNSLQALESASFPDLPTSVVQPKVDQVLKFSFEKHDLASEWPYSTIVHAAWAIVAGRYSNSNSVTFGRYAPISDSKVPFNEFQSLTQSELLSVRIKLPGNQSLPIYLQKVAAQVHQGTQWKKERAQPIAELDEKLNSKPHFQTVIELQSLSEGPEKVVSSGENHAQPWIEDSPFALNLQIILSSVEIRIVAGFDSRVIDSYTIQKIAGQFDYVMRRLSQTTPKSSETLDEIDYMTIQEKAELSGWLEEGLPNVERCIHDLIDERTREQPHALALDAWDGKLTYGELGDLSTRLGHYLARHGVGPGKVVPLCFEKSVFTAVAMLGVLKAGGAFLLLETSLPRARLDLFCRKVNASIVLASSTTTELAGGLAEHVIILDRFMVSQFPTPDSALPTIYPSDTAYIIFTSGSTGEPKGCRIDHGSSCSVTLRNGPALRVQPGTRVLQACSYSFAGALLEFILTLAHGGCLCIVTDEDRRLELDHVLSSMKINWVWLTPTVLELVNVEAATHLQTLCVGGEPIRKSQVEKWANRLHLRQTFGCSETACGIVSSAHLHRNSSTRNVGKGITGRQWFVDPTNTDKLVPIGATGELVVEGFGLAREYINQPEKTAATFIETPKWRALFPQHQSGSRFYRTGDLGVYKEDGTIELLGRKDTQVKIRGQRIELGEIEHHVKIASPDVKQVAVELIKPLGNENSAILICFVVLASGVDLKRHVAEETNSSLAVDKAMVHAIQENLEKLLPHYMIPALFRALPAMFKNSSGKTDRKRLQEIGNAVIAQQISSTTGTFANNLSADSTNVRLTETEKWIRLLWAKVLDVKPSCIGLDDNFFRLGGDSMSAMKLAKESKRAFTVASIFQHPTLRHLALASRKPGGSAITRVATFSLLPTSVNEKSICDEIATNYDIEKGLIEDVYPCIPLQEGLLSMTARISGAYVLQTALRMRPDFDRERFQTAWNQLLSNASIFRTRIVQSANSGLLQVVLAEKPQWKDVEGDLDTFLADDRNIPMGFGDSLSRFCFVHDEKNDDTWFVWTMHHVFYDGWSVPRVLDVVRQAYVDKRAPRLPKFNSFVKYLQEQDHTAKAKFWEASLASCAAPIFPELPLTVHQPIAHKVVEIQSFISSHSHTTVHTTPSNIVRAAWALVASSYTCSEEVVFGILLSGRNASINDVEDIPGPTITTVPMHILAAKQMTISSYLERIHQKVIDMMPHEQIGLQNIAKLSEACRHACRFQSLLVVHPIQEHLNDIKKPSIWYEELRFREGVMPYGITVSYMLRPDGATINAKYDPDVLDEATVQRMLWQLSSAAQQLIERDPSQAISNIDLALSHDKETIWGWNREVPTAAQGCLPDIISQRAVCQPDSPAVDSWDGRFTYRELDTHSTILAYHLVGLGVKDKTVVPLYFEKSYWTVVAMIAVLKSGGAFLLLDAKDAPARRASMLRQVNPVVILTSKHLKEEMLNFKAIVEAVDAETSNRWPDGSASNPLSTRGPRSMAYVIFTSGSTGTPKGVVIEHQSVLTSCLENGKILDLNPHSRTLQFSSYAFDASIMETFATLLFGACLLIPSDSDRMNRLESYVQRAKPTLCILVPSVARLLKPSCVPSVKTVKLVGEASRPDDFERWKGFARLVHGFGPAEASICCSAKIVDFEFDESKCIGKGVGAALWVVDPSNDQMLTPLGVTGELLIEGPILARGYLEDREKTEASFINDPAWLLAGCSNTPGRRGRLYKTGDLVRYLEDGSLIFVGRNDKQTKIRGQRVELGEVEFHVAQYLSNTVGDDLDIFVEAVHDSGLVAFVARTELDQMQDGNAQLAAICKSEAKGLFAKLSQVLPSYMIPIALLPLTTTPRTLSGKVDRKALTRLFQNQTENEGLNGNQSVEVQAPRNETERAVRELWASILGISHERIAVDHSFTQLGGDSIQLMSLSYALRTQFDRTIDISYLVRKTTTLSELAKVIDKDTNGTFKPVDVDADKQLAMWTSKLDQVLSSRPARCITILLTGATGYVGSYILRNLLEQAAVGKVIVLTRPRSGAAGSSGLDRIKDVAVANGWWIDAHEKKIESWHGDLAKERLGLTESQWSSLSDLTSPSTCVDMIIHNGAIVNWSADYHTLEKANVNSTFQLLDLATRLPTFERFVYIAGGSLSMEAEPDSMAKFAYSEGYSQTKFLSEMMVVKTARQLKHSGKHFTVMRLGSIIGDVETGVPNVDDLLWRLTITAVALKVYPQNDPGNWLVVSHGLNAANTVWRQLDIDSPASSLLLSDGLPVQTYWDTVQDQLQVRLKPKSWNVWLDIARRDIADHQERHPLWPVQHMLDRLPILPAKPNLSGLAKEGEIEAAVRKNLEFLSNSGFLSGYGAYGQTRVNVARRSALKNEVLVS